MPALCEGTSHENVVCMYIDNCVCYRSLVCECMFASCEGLSHENIMCMYMKNHMCCRSLVRKYILASCEGKSNENLVWLYMKHFMYMLGAWYERACSRRLKRNRMRM